MKMSFSLGNFEINFSYSDSSAEHKIGNTTHPGSNNLVSGGFKMGEYHLDLEAEKGEYAEMFKALGEASSQIVSSCMKAFTEAQSDASANSKIDEIRTSVEHDIQKFNEVDEASDGISVQDLVDDGILTEEEVEKACSDTADENQ